MNSSGTCRDIFLQMPLRKTKSKSPPLARRIPLRPLPDLSTDMDSSSPAQFPPETASALSQVNPSPGFENLFRDPSIALRGANEDVNEENVIPGSPSSWQTVSLTRSAKGKSPVFTDTFSVVCQGRKYCFACILCHDLFYISSSI